MTLFAEKIIIILKLFFHPKCWNVSWKMLLGKTFAALGFISVVITTISFFGYDGSNISKNASIIFLILITSVLVGIYLSLPPLTVSRTIAGRDISITVEVGNIFSQDADIVVPTNTTFETKFDNDFISKHSIQGQLTEREYEGKTSELDKDLEEQLKNNSKFVVISDKTRKNKQYEIGTVVKLNHDKKFKSYWIALANVNDFGKPDGQFENILIGLDGLWNFLGEKGHMSRLALPILGSGRTGVVVSRFEIFQEIVVSFIAHSLENTRKISEDLVVCVNPNDLISGKINIYEMEKYLDCQCRYKYKKKNVLSTSKGISELGEDNQM